jgi:hypothetical protein
MCKNKKKKISHKIPQFAHDICPKTIFGIFWSKLNKNQKRFFGYSFHIGISI